MMFELLLKCLPFHYMLIGIYFMRFPCLLLAFKSIWLGYDRGLELSKLIYVEL